MSIRNNLGPARWVKNPKPNEHGKPHWESSKRLEPDKGVEAKMEVASSGSSQQAVAGGGQSAGPSASEPSTKQSTNLILPALKTALKTAPSEVITLDFQSLDTVRDVKENLKMHKQVNRPPEQQRLMLADKQLEDHCTLAHYKIDSKSTLKLELPPGLAIGDVFCIVLHSLGTGDPVVSSQHATSFALLLRFSHVDRHMVTHANFDLTRVSLRNGRKFCTSLTLCPPTTFGSKAWMYRLHRMYRLHNQARCPWKLRPVSLRTTINRIRREGGARL